MPPRHQVVARLIQRSIAAGDLSPGQPLPPDEVLANRYKASSEELRLAIAHLRTSGLITDGGPSGAAVGRPPAQSHVTSASVNYLKPLPNPDRQFRESAGQVGLNATQQAETDIETASAEIADRLDLKLGQQVLHRRTVRLTNAVPTELEDTYYPCRLVGSEPTVIDDLGDDFLHGLGWTRVGWEDAITARNASETEAAILGLGAVPVIDRTRLRYAMRGDAQPQRVSYTQSVLVGVRNRLIYNMKQADLPQ
ncbi:GntR family transcriptional regulator [Kribbella sp. NBC_00889]|uniref:GntR family transcriptional regulator n=1 Tax=Kribbella sp. NBC_00889 TaxID=2975974 RepID=UPI00386EFEBA|nr:GntR family transcriptional regulator [Kribbella sp. NBC_00889]